jgi:ADP-heptose:LPS heptosyltransferase
VAVSRQVLALRALGIGDLLTALPALRALRDDRLPPFLCVLAAPAWLAPLALHSGAVDAVADTRPLAPIPVRRPELAVNLHGCGPESLRRVLETKPARVIAFRHPEVPMSAGWPAWRQDEHEVQRWCRLLVESGIPADPGRLDLSTAGLPAPAAARGATLLHPGAKSASRRWPVERWAEVARGEAARGRPVVVSAGPGEAGLARAVAHLAGGGSSRPAVVAVDGVLDLAGLVAASARVACGDTGVAHLATAFRRPSVVLFGPTPPALWGPPPGRPHRVLWSGRAGDPHGDRPDSGLLEIEPTTVLRALAGLPAGDAA